MKRAIVTGASRGIGRAVTEMLLAEGWDVIGISRTDPCIEHLDFSWMQWDLSGPPDTDEFFAYLRPDHDFPPNALIHCAGVRGPQGSLWENDEAAWLQTIQTNLLGTYRVVRQALPLLQRSEDARILLFSGGGAFNPSPGFSSYAVSKAGVVSLMETLAEELSGSTVTVNCVAPGPVPTTIHTPPMADDGGAAMAQAVACVRHLLGPQTEGLTGKTISANWDDWAHLHHWNVSRVNASADGTRDRRPIAMLQARMRAV